MRPVQKRVVVAQLHALMQAGYQLVALRERAPERCFDEPWIEAAGVQRD
jgi:hypothetical protein